MQPTGPSSSGVGLQGVGKRADLHWVSFDVTAPMGANRAEFALADCDDAVGAATYDYDGVGLYSASDRPRTAIRLRIRSPRVSRASRCRLARLSKVQLPGCEDPMNQRIAFLLTLLLGLGCATPSTATPAASASEVRSNAPDAASTAPAVAKRSPGSTAEPESPPQFTVDLRRCTREAKPTDAVSAVVTFDGSVVTVSGCSLFGQEFFDSQPAEEYSFQRIEVRSARGATLYRRHQSESALCRRHEVPPPPDGGSFSNISRALANPTDPHTFLLVAPIGAEGTSIVWFDGPCRSPAVPLAKFIVR